MIKNVLCKLISSFSLLLLVGMGCCSTAYAQNLDAEFEVIDLGDIAFEHPATANFSLKNRGSEFFLKEVKPFCGCTEVQFPKKTIKKGESFDVSVTYDALMLGHFQKDVAILSDQFEQPFYLTVKGNVVRELPEQQAIDYDVVMGNLKVATNNVVFDDAHQGDVLQVKIPFSNPNALAVSPIVTHVPSYMTAQVTPNTILPGKQGIINLQLNASMLPSEGLTRTKIYLVVDPGKDISKDCEINVSAVKLPSLILSESQRLNPPMIKLSSHDLLLSGSQLKGEITIANIGRSPLHISTLQATHLGLTITLSDTTINPGSSAVLKVKGAKNQLKNMTEEPQILLISDDPSCQKSVINVKTK